jgi:hypothetical protein
MEKAGIISRSEKKKKGDIDTDKEFKKLKY